MPAPTSGYDSDMYAWSYAQELYRSLDDWARRASRGEARSSADELTRRRLGQLLAMPGVAEVLGPADADAQIIVEELFDALHMERPQFSGESPEVAAMRNTVWLGVLFPIVALLIGGLAVQDLSEVGVSTPGAAGVGVASVLATISARFWVRRGKRRQPFI